jgi:hypothetical protein
MNLTFSRKAQFMARSFFLCSAAESLFFRKSHPDTRTLFRDYLITHPETAKKYGELKIRIREKSGFDLEVYTRENGIRPSRVQQVRKAGGNMDR